VNSKGRSKIEKHKYRIGNAATTVYCSFFTLCCNDLVYPSQTFYVVMYSVRWCKLHNDIAMSYR